MIEFWRTTDEWGCLSNFAKYPIEIDGKTWKTNEHYYQAMKYEDEAIQEKIRTAPSPKEAKNIAYDQGVSIKSDWDTIKFDVMRKAIKAKHDQHEFIQYKLKQTGNQPLAEASPYDYIWGTGKDGTGSNWLGKLWMELRDGLHSSSSACSNEG